MAAVHVNDEIGQIDPRLGPISIRHLEPQIVVLHVCLHPRVGFGDAAELRLPLTIEDDPVDVTALRVRLPAVLARGSEVHVTGRSSWVVRIENRLDGLRPHQSARDGRGDTLACHVGERLVHQLRRLRLTLTHQAAVQPLSGNPFELVEEIEPWLFARIPPFGVEQTPRQVVQERRRTDILEVLEAEIDLLADNTRVSGDRRSDEVRSELQDGVCVELGREVLLRQLDAVALDTRKANFQGIAFRAHSFHLNRLARGLRRRDHRFGGEVERHAQHIGILHVEQTSRLIQVVGLPAERATDHLLAQQLCAERADPKHVGNGVGVPAFGEHGHRDDAANGLAQTVHFANGVRHLAQQVRLRDVLRRSDVTRALDDLAPEALDLVGGHSAKVDVERITRFKLLAINQQGVRPSEWSVVVVVVAEEWQSPVHHIARPVFVLAYETRHVVVDEFGGGRVIADDNETWRDANAGLAP